MKSQEIVFLSYPNRIIVCESCDSPLPYDPVTHESIVYARIVKFLEYANFEGTELNYPGDIEWEEERKSMLSPEQIKSIESMAERQRHEEGF